MYQPYYIVGGLRVAKTNREYIRLRQEDKMREKFAEHSTSMKQVIESYQEYKNNCY